MQAVWDIPDSPQVSINEKAESRCVAWDINGRISRICKQNKPTDQYLDGYMCYNYKTVAFQFSDNSVRFLSALIITGESLYCQVTS